MDHHRWANHPCPLPFSIVFRNYQRLLSGHTRVVHLLTPSDAPQLCRLLLHNLAKGPTTSHVSRGNLLWQWGAIRLGNRQPGFIFVTLFNKWLIWPCHDVIFWNAWCGKPGKHNNQQSQTHFQSLESHNSVGKGGCPKNGSKHDSSFNSKHGSSVQIFGYLGSL